MYTHNKTSSKLLEQAVDAFNSLPGIGRRTALKLALYILRQPKENVGIFANNIFSFREKVKRCHVCHNVSDSDLCNVCADPGRDRTTVCVVQDVQDVIAIENTRQFNGLYHVLGGLISPVDGVGPADLNIESLVERVSHGDIKEVVFAVSSTTDGETTKFFISRKLAEFPIKMSSISSGISVGEEIEYTDEVTLGQSLLNRININ